MTPKVSCAYVTQGWGVHDDRWVAALQDSGYAVEIFSRDRDGSSVEDILDALERGRGPVLAGPLDSITNGLASSSRPIVGLSWGFDLLQMHRAGADLAWMQELQSLIVDSRTNRDIALQSGVPVNQIFEIPWGVDTDAFTAQGEVLGLNEFNLPPSARIILSLRALEATYRVIDIIDAFAQIHRYFPDTYLLVGNEGYLRDELESRSISRGVWHQVRFIGKLEEHELPALFRASAVYITASEVDGTSVTLLQAMACGIPVVASDIPGNRQWVAPERAGSLFKANSPGSLARRLRKTLDSPPGMKERAAARATVVEHANWAINSAALGPIMRGQT